MKIRLSELRKLINESLTEHDMLFDSPKRARALYDRFKEPEWPELKNVIASGRLGSAFEGPEGRIVKVFGVPRSSIDRVQARLSKVLQVASPHIMGLDSFGITPKAITGAEEYRSWHLGYYMGERLVPLSNAQRAEVPEFIERARSNGIEHDDVNVAEEDYRNVMSTPKGELKFIDIEDFLRIA